MCNNDFYMESLMPMHRIALHLLYGSVEAPHSTFIRTRNRLLLKKFLYIDRC